MEQDTGWTAAGSLCRILCKVKVKGTLEILVGWLVVLGFNATLSAKIRMYAFSGFLTPLLTQLFFPKALTIFLTCFSRGERRKYVGKKVRLNQVSNSQPPVHESDALTTEPFGRGS